MVMQYLRMIWMRRAIVLTAAGLGLLLGIAAYLVTPPVYQATSRIMLDILKPDPVTGQAMTTPAAKVFASTQIQLIKDYRTAGKVVDAFGWANSKELAAAFEKRSSGDSPDFRRWLAQRVMNSTNAAFIEGSNIIEITYRASSSDAARKGADAVRDAYVSQTLAFKRDDLDRNAAWFTEQKQRLETELAQAEKKKADFEKAHGIILDQNDNDIETERLKALASVPDMPTVAPVTTGPNPAVAQIDAQIAELSQTLGPNHPQLAALQRQRAALAASSRSGTVMRATGPSASAMLNEQMRKVLAQRGLIGEAQRIASEVARIREQFNRTAGKATELEQQARSSETGVIVLGGAVSPERPLYPLAYQVVPAGLLAGLGLGIVLALLIELLNRKVRGAEDLAMEHLPVLGAMRPDEERAPPKDIWYWLGLDRSRVKRA